MLERSRLHSNEINQEMQAQWMHTLLTAVYGKHALSSTEEQILKEIQDGRLIPRFGSEEGRLLRGAAFVIGQNTIEIGRAANMPGANGGGVLMLEMAHEWEQDETEKPLVAEIRMAQEFEGIAGGQGSQATLWGKAELIPQAFLTAFGHRGPFGPMRQELFGFSSREKKPSDRITPNIVMLPDLSETNAELIRHLLRINGFQTQLVLEKPDLTATAHIRRRAFVPFNFFTLDDEEGVLVSEVPRTKPQGENPFDLVVIPANHESLNGTASGLIRNGFQIAGISAPHEGELHFLFGRLGKCLLAPTEVMRGFPFFEKNLIMQVHERFAQQSKE